MLRFYRIFVKWFLRLLYTRLAVFYNLVAKTVSKGEWYNWVNQIEIYLHPNDKILEVGFGTGELFHYLSEKRYQVFGIELSKQMIKICKTANKFEEFKLVRGNNESIAFENDSFDKVISTFPSDYVYKPQFINEALTILKKNGVLIILMCVTFTNQGFLNWFYQLIYKISGQSNSKEKIEVFLNEFYSNYSCLEVDWITYQDVELCFMKIKKC